MITRAFNRNVYPDNVFSWQHPGKQWFEDNNLYGFLKDVDPTKVSIYLNVSCSGGLPKCSTPIAIFSLVGESPRWEALNNFCSANPNVKIILLADLDLYDYPLQDQISFLPYRTWIWYLDWFINAQPVRPIHVKDKKINWKFSSLSFKVTQFRALVTAFLLEQASDQSLISWHAVSDDKAAYWMQTFRENPRFENLNWSLLDRRWLVDDYDWSKNAPAENLADLLHPAFSQSLININNETDSFGWKGYDGNVPYNRPGPYLTEKTWKSLLSGCVVLNSGQPGLYKWLESHYNIPCGWAIPKEYDNEIKDFDRAEALLSTLQSLCDRELTELIDSNIDCCDHVQKLLLDPDYLDRMDNFNRQQDHKILDLCHSM